MFTSFFVVFLTLFNLLYYKNKQRINLQVSKTSNTIEDTSHKVLGEYDD